MPQVVLRAKELHKAFYKPSRVSILCGVDLTVHRGEAVAITGRSGEGKSTLLQLLGTLDAPCSGTLEIADQTVSPFNKCVIRNRHLAFIFQSFHLLEDYSALDNVLMPARIARRPVTPGSEAYRHGIHLLERVGLGNRIHFNTKLLSGGEKQRVAIARALCNDPDLILADEPSGNLDKETAAAIHSLLLQFVKDGKKSLVIVTHDQELSHLCHRRYTLQGGLLHLT